MFFLNRLALDRAKVQFARQLNKQNFIRIHTHINYLNLFMPKNTNLPTIYLVKVQCKRQIQEKTHAQTEPSYGSTKYEASSAVSYCIVVVSRYMCTYHATAKRVYDCFLSSLYFVYFIRSVIATTAYMYTPSNCVFNMKTADSFQ